MGTCCVILLRPLSLPDYQNSASLGDHEADMWSDESLQAILKIRLGEDHHTYVAIQDRLKKRVQHMCRMLHLDKNGQLTLPVRNGSMRWAPRFRFMKGLIGVRYMRVKFYTLLHDTGCDIEMLARLASETVYLTSARGFFSGFKMHCKVLRTVLYTPASIEHRTRRNQASSLKFTRPRWRKVIPDSRTTRAAGEPRVLEK